MAGFYEEDEPAERIVAAFNAGPKGVTEPRRGWTFTLTFWPDGPRLVAAD